ncbi:MAG TPA: TRAP transporter small permease [Rhizobiaceae bacterium]|nr:TRAP transporter small permease [Rhizobiaceae bacterium]
MAETRNPIVRFFAALEFRVLEAGLLILLVLNTLTIFSRYIMGRPMGSLFELMVLGSVAMYWLGAATAERVGGHLGMDFLVTKFPAGLQRINEWFVKAVTIAFLAVVIYSGYKLSRSQIAYGAHSGMLKIPMWLFSGFMPLAALLYLWRVVTRSKGTRSADEAPL